MGYKAIYLDNSSTTKVFPEVVKEMQRYYMDEYGNPSSPHQMGEDARKSIDKARKEIALELRVKAHEIIFNSGGTESNNMALNGLTKGRRKIIISAIEHSSVRETCSKLKEIGYEIVEIGVDREGFLNINKLENEIDEKTVLVSVMHGNNEIGVLQELRKIGEICRKRRVLFHTDAVQSFGKERINVRDMSIDMLSASAHKIGGPKGIGVLYLREGIELEPLIYGGGQEKGMRGGTENVPAIMGFAKALEIMKREDKEKVRKMRDRFISELEKLGGRINGSKEKRLWNNVNVSFPFDAEIIVLKLSRRGIYCSTRSACLTKQKEESHVLKAIGLKEREMQGSLRFGLFVDTKKQELWRCIEELKKVLDYSGKVEA